MNITTQNILKNAIGHCDTVLVEIVYQSLPEGELIKGSEIQVNNFKASEIMRALTVLKKQGRVKTYQYKNIQLWGRVDEFSNS